MARRGLHVDLVDSHVGRVDDFRTSSLFRIVYGCIVLVGVRRRVGSYGQLAMWNATGF